MSGIAKRRLYKPERPPARVKGVIGKDAPHSCLDASKLEVAMALYSLCREAGVVVGRGAEYEPLRDEYTVIGKSKATGKAQEIKVQGEEVGLLIHLARSLNGGKMSKAASRLPEVRQSSTPQIPPA